MGEVAPRGVDASLDARSHCCTLCYLLRVRAELPLVTFLFREPTIEWALVVLSGLFFSNARSTRCRPAFRVCASPECFTPKVVVVVVIVRRHPWFSNQGVPGVGTDSFAIS